MMIMVVSMMFAMIIMEHNQYVYIYIRSVAILAQAWF